MTDRNQVVKRVVFAWGLIVVLAASFTIIWFCPGSMYGYGKGLEGIAVLSFLISNGILITVLALSGLFTYIAYRVRRRRGAYGDFRIRLSTIFQYWLPMIAVLSLSAMVTSLIAASLGPAALASVMGRETYDKMEQERQLIVEFSLRREQAPWATSEFQDAVQRGDLATVTKYLRYGADPKAANGFGQTALHISVLASNEPLVRRFLALGVDINARDREKETPLHDACKKGDIGILRLLIDAGADMNAVSEFGTPLDIAEDYHDDKAIEILKRAGANRAEGASPG